MDNLAAYVHVGALSVMIWDISNHIKTDFSLLFLYDFCQHVALYTVARYMTFLYVIAKTVFLTARTPHCGPLESAISVFYMVAISATLLQSSIRLWKLLGRKGNMLAIFGSLWLLTTGGNITFAFGVVGQSSTLSAGGACVDHIRGDYVSMTLVALVVYHACMLVTMVLAIRQNVFVDRERLTVLERYERMVRGASSLFLAHPLTIDDRVFHVVSTALSLASVIWFSVMSLTLTNGDASLRLALIVVYLVCTNILMGRVFRHTVLNAESQNGPSTPPTISSPRSLKYNRRTREIEVGNKNLCDQPGIDRVLKLGAGTDGYDGRGRRMYDADVRPTSPAVKVEVQQVTEYRHDFAAPESECNSDASCHGHMYV